MKVLMLLIMFLMVGGFFIISNENLSLRDDGDVDKFFELYGSWMDGLIDNGGGVMGHVVKMEWLPEHEVHGVVDE